jgi:benzylsuccinate CoA-transferase BbsF subunit
MAAPDWMRDGSLATAAGRLARRAEIDEAVATWTKQHDPIDLADRLQAAGVSAGNVAHVTDLLADANLAERGFFLDVDHPEVGRLPHAGLPWAITPRDDTPVAHSPLLGEHNWEIFVEWLGMDVERFSELVAGGIIQ